ncbi:MAG: precorrin-6y C5,15-methyltransferase (decarboxylating) subunit CbiE [Lachnospiraceae bacterium]|nr:precorrin-6y C5,15-methyltransferase (decarboxylating) subunit CbiE [Lachnospiraceae bacterium]
MNQVYIIGMGPGEVGYLTKKAEEVISLCPFLTGSSRLLETVVSVQKSGVTLHVLKRLAECFDWIEQKQKMGDVGVLVSGDVNYYSLAGTITRAGYNWKICYIPGISSYQVMAAKVGITLEDVALRSVHGRNESDGYVVRQVSENQKTLFLCSRDFPPERIAMALTKYGLEETKLWIGSNLTMEEEQIVSLTAKQASVGKFPGFSVVYVENKLAKPLQPMQMLKDADFIRGKVPMTKEEIRILIIHKLQIKADDCLWDLGAGTGSISIEMARHVPFGSVYSVEYKEGALHYIQQNKDKFQCQNLKIINGRIAKCLEKLPIPDRVFLGGSEGELKQVVSYLTQLPKQIHFVMTVVTMETLAEAIGLLAENETFSYTQVQIGLSRKVGSYHTTQMNHPIWILEVDL